MFVKVKKGVELCQTLHLLSEFCLFFKRFLHLLTGSFQLILQSFQFALCSLQLAVNTSQDIVDPLDDAIGIFSCFNGIAASAPDS